LVVKLAFTVFTAAMVSVFCALYGPAVLLYFCCVAVLLVLGALWLESPLLVGMAAVGVLVGQALWTVDFVSGANLVGMTAYMFEERYPLYARFLTLFHVWLPVFMLWLLSRLGYDRWSFWAMVVLCWALLLVSYLWLPAPPAAPNFVDPDSIRAVNINYVYGLGATPQTVMHPWLWVVMLMVVFPVVFYLPIHLLLSRVFSGPGEP
jgi:hypothetical protein